jgi:predicted transcriptional regulator
MGRLLFAAFGYSNFKLMMEAASTSDTSVNFYQTIRRYNPEDSHLHTHRRESPKYYLLKQMSSKLKKFVQRNNEIAQSVCYAMASEHT